MRFWKKLFGGKRADEGAPAVAAPASVPAPLTAPEPAALAPFVELPATERAQAWRQALEHARPRFAGADALPAKGGGVLLGKFGTKRRSFRFTGASPGVTALTVEMAVERAALILQLGAAPTPRFPTQVRVALVGDLHHVVPPGDLEHSTALRNLLPVARYAEWAAALAAHPVHTVSTLLDSVYVFFTDDLDPRGWDVAASLDALLGLVDTLVDDLEALPAVLPESLLRCDYCTRCYDPSRGLVCPQCGAPTTAFKRPPDLEASTAAAGVAPTGSVQAELDALAAAWPTPLQPFRSETYAGVAGRHAERPFTLRGRHDRAELRLNLRLEAGVGWLRLGRDGAAPEGEGLPDRLDDATLALLRGTIERTGASQLRVEGTYVQATWAPATEQVTAAWLEPRLAALVPGCAAIERLPSRNLITARHCLYCDALTEQAAIRCRTCGATFDAR